MVKISIIIPVYNVISYIDQCIKSVINQTYRNLEIICVDDGSTDESGNRCDYWALQDERIKVVHKNNGGLSSARNVGLENATGEYIAFVDSDDIINSRMIEILYNDISSNNCEIAAGGIETFVDGKFSIRKRFMKGNTGVFPSNEYAEKILRFQIDNAVWNKLYSRLIVSDTRFKEGIINEDFPFIMELLARNAIISYNETVCYYYRSRKGSITRHLHPRSYDFVKNGYDFKANLYERFRFKDSSAIDSYIKTQEINQIFQILKYKAASERRDILRKCRATLSINVLWQMDVSVKAKIKYVIACLNPEFYK